VTCTERQFPSWAKIKNEVVIINLPGVGGVERL
jgi:hypothetical protein